MKKIIVGFILGSVLVVTLLVMGYSYFFVGRSTDNAERDGNYPIITRLAKIPPDVSKVTPDTDPSPPRLHSDEFEQPVPLPSPVNTAGVEDSPFVATDRSELYFFFTPDVRVPAEQQLNDGVTGIWWSRKEDSGWSEPERVWLQRSGAVALDGCPYVTGETMWFCSTREGYSGIHWFTAIFEDERWDDWKNRDFDASFKVGELHFSTDGSEIYFGSDRSGGKGEHDIYIMRKNGESWFAPEAIDEVNTAANEIQPFSTTDGNELWFTRTYQGTPAVFRSKKVGGAWQKPELIVSRFAGEPTLDADGNLYFVHHYYKNNAMIEADIYVANKKK